MTQPQEKDMAPPAMERTEQVVHEVGERIGLWAGRVVQRMQRAAGALNQEADRMDAPGAASDEQAAGQGQLHQLEQATMQRAEEIVDKMGTHVARWTVEGNVRMRRALARLREDMEDLWVEAHEKQEHMKHGQHEEVK